LAGFAHPTILVQVPGSVEPNLEFACSGLAPARAPLQGDFAEACSKPAAHITFAQRYKEKRREKRAKNLFLYASCHSAPGLCLVHVGLEGIKAHSKMDLSPISAAIDWVNLPAASTVQMAA
jgi:hypothetical protein